MSKRPSGLKYIIHKENPTSFKKGQIPWNKGMKRWVPWNKGLTKETNDSIKKYSETLSITNKGKKLNIDYDDVTYRLRISKRMKENNPVYKEGVKEKIRQTLLNTYKDHPEIKEKIGETLINTYKNHPEILANRKSCGYNQNSDHFTSIEQIIKDELEFNKINYLHNCKIGKYSVDFLILNDVVIECDGEYWHRNDTNQSKRDSYLQDKGYFIFHLLESRINNDSKSCISMITNIMSDLHAHRRYT